MCVRNQQANLSTTTLRIYRLRAAFTGHSRTLLRTCPSHFLLLQERPYIPAFVKSPSWDPITTHEQYPDVVIKLPGQMLTLNKHSFTKQAPTLLVVRNLATYPGNFLM